jgi:hypothetical protein
VLCAFFLLLAFHLFLRYAETGRPAFYLAQWVVFVVGFGALELNVVYPGIALAYAAVRRSRKLAWKAAAMVPVSVLYAVIHRMASPENTPGIYRMHWDASILTTFWQDWQWALAASRVGIVRHIPWWFGPAATGALTVGLVGFVFWKSRRGEWLGWFFLAWFAGVVAPLLPLRDHAMDYYLAIPSAGLAMLGAWGVVSAFRHSAAAGAGASALAAVYLWSAIPVDRAVARWYFERGRAVEITTLGVARAHELHPGKLILLNGVGDELFWSGVYDRPFLLFGANEVYLTPGSEKSIWEHPDIGLVGNYVLSTSEARRSLDRGDAVVYQVGGPRLKNVTSYYQEHVAETWTLETPRFVDAGQKVFSDLFNQEWYPIDGAYRWMAQRAGLRIGGPRAGGEKLYVVGYCPAGQLAQGPVRLQVKVSGVPLGAVEVHKSGQFEAALEVPAALVGVEWVELQLEVDRTYRPPGDDRARGLAFGTFTVR